MPRSPSWHAGRRPARASRPWLATSAYRTWLCDPSPQAPLPDSPHGRNIICINPTLAAARAGKTVLLANKETLVVAGQLFMQAVAESGATLLPIDSEHNAIFQALPPRFDGNLPVNGVAKIILTASGGPFRGRTRADLESVTVEQALAFFSAVPSIARKLHTLQDVGLAYIRLGQSATTLSGGEAQRVKLALELSKRDTGRTLYILDEPTTGLHFADIEMLLSVLHQLRDAGNTIVVIEHNLDVIKTADWLIDMGPEGGDGGGRLVASGTPEDVAANAASHTGRYLASLLRR